MSFSVRCWLLLFLFLSVRSLAQDKTFTGYYTTLSGDTVRGAFPSYGQWNLNPSAVNFIPGGSQAPVVLTPANCSSFHVDRYDTYIAYRGTRMTNPVQYHNAVAIEENADRYDTVTTFLREIAVAEPYRFYSLRDRLRTNLYYARRGEKPQELLQKVSLVDNAYRESVVYRHQVETLNLPGVSGSTIQKLAYSEESFIKFFSKKEERARKLKNPYDGFLVMAGASFNNLRFSGMVSHEFEGYKGSVSPLGSIGYLAHFNRNFSRAFLFPYVMVHGYKAVSESRSPGSQSVTNTFRAGPVVSLGLQAGYHLFATPTLRAFVAPGVAAAFLNKNRHERQIVYSATSSDKNTSTMPDLSFSFRATTGVIIRSRFVLWAAYQPGMPVTNFVYVKGRLSSVQAGVGYRL